MFLRPGITLERRGKKFERDDDLNIRIPERSGYEVILKGNLCKLCVIVSEFSSICVNYISFCITLKYGIADLISLQEAEAGQEAVHRIILPWRGRRDSSQTRFTSLSQMNQLILNIGPRLPQAVK
jgi:hypothetical protein